MRLTQVFLPLLVAVLLIGCGEKQKTLEILTIDLADSLQIIPITDSLVRPVLYHHIPDFRDLSPQERKANFIATVLPAILVAKFRLGEKRTQIKQLSSQEEWDPEDSSFYVTQQKRFKSNNVQDLINRMKTHPNSIILAQAAVESGWGTSRFFQEANNLFGIWSYRSDESRIQASSSRGENQIYLRKYEDVSESIIDYFETIGRSRPYRWFRKARTTTDDIEVLLPNLKYYSERKGEYVAQLKTIITQNDLTQYDHYRIDPKYIVEE